MSVDPPRDTSSIDADALARLREGRGHDPAAILLEATGLNRTYAMGSERIEILRGADLTLRQGEILAVVGASGSGKSTLLHILGTLDRPDGGSVRFQGEDLFTRNDRDLARFRNRHLGFVFQFHHLLPEFTALENVAMPGRIRGLSKREAEAHARELLGEVRLLDRAGHKPGELSGGEQQRVAVARALFGHPRLVLADEPTGNLDPTTAKGLHELMYTLARKSGQSWIVVTHNEQLAQLADTIGRLEDGVLRTYSPHELDGPRSDPNRAAGT